MVKQSVKNFSDLLRDNAQLFSDRVAVIEDNNKLNYSQLNCAVDDFSRKLSAVKENSIYPVSHQSGIDFVVEYLAAIRSGLIVVPINYYMENQINFSKFPKDVFSIQYTSGSTGRPKGVMLKNGALIEFGKMHINAWRLRSGEVFLPLVPLFFCAPNGLSVVLQTAGTVVFCDFSDLTAVVKKNKVTVILAALPHIAKMADRKISIPSVKFVHCIGSSVPVELLNKFEKNTSTKLSTAYGLVESSYACTLNNPVGSMRKLGTEGKPLPAVKVKITNGEILIKSKILMGGYLEDKQLTSKTIKNGWLHTGDLGYIDKDGCLVHLGRSDDMFKCSGVKVYPVEIERLICKYPNITDSAVVGIPDKYKGMSPKLFIVPKSGFELNKPSLIRFLKGKIPKFMLPKQIRIISEMPLTGSGKIDRVALKAYS